MRILQQSIDEAEQLEK